MSSRAVTFALLSAVLLVLSTGVEPILAGGEQNEYYCVQFDDCLVYMDDVMRSGKFDGEVFSVNVNMLCELTRRRPKTIRWSHGAWIPPVELEAMHTDIEKWSRISTKKLKRSRRVAQANNDSVATQKLSKQIRTIKPLYADYVQALQNEHQRCTELYRQCMEQAAHQSNCMGRYLECRQ